MKKQLMIITSLCLTVSSFCFPSVSFAADKYENYEELAANEQIGEDYVIRTRSNSSNVTVMAIHGGGIEPGTSKIAEGIAGDNYNLYLFEGKKPAGENRDLHITSTHFDEPAAVKMAARAHKVVSVHGAAGVDTQIVYMGGNNHYLKEIIARKLAEKNFEIAPTTPPEYAGTNPKNICNMNRTHAGVQMELTRGLRDELSSKPERFEDFATAVRQGISAAYANPYERVFDFNYDNFTSSTWINGGKLFYLDQSDYILGVQNPNNTNDSVTIRFNVYDQNNRLVMSRTKTSSFREGLIKHQLTGLPSGYYKIQIVNTSKLSSYVYAGLHY